RRRSRPRLPRGCFRLSPPLLLPLPTRSPMNGAPPDRPLPPLSCPGLRIETALIVGRYAYRVVLSSKRRRRQQRRELLRPKRHRQVLVEAFQQVDLECSPRLLLRVGLEQALPLGGARRRVSPLGGGERFRWRGRSCCCRRRRRCHRRLFVVAAGG
ncbi:unnamed protein product, partial [Ectocarpus sp. 12 AP-2014]